MKKIEPTLKALTLLICIVKTMSLNAQNVISTGFGQTNNKLPKWTNAATLEIQNSQITDNVDVSIGTGNIDISTAAKCYMINGTPFLWHNGTTTSIYAGVGAGNAGITGTYNTLIGNNAGATITSGHFNTCVGANTGSNISDSKWNVCIGYNGGNSLNNQNRLQIINIL